MENLNALQTYCHNFQLCEKPKQNFINLICCEKKYNQSIIKIVVQTHQETSSSLLLHKSADISPMTQINISTPNILDGLKSKTKDVLIIPFLFI